MRATLTCANCGRALKLAVYHDGKWYCPGACLVRRTKAGTQPKETGARRPEGPMKRYGVWWVETFSTHYGHAMPIGGQWCVDTDGHTWSGDKDQAEGKAQQMERFHPSNKYESRELH